MESAKSEWVGIVISVVNLKVVGIPKNVGREKKVVSHEIAPALIAFLGRSREHNQHRHPLIT